MDTYSLCAVSILALWLALAILLQFPQLQRFRSADLLALIPDFSFFASDAPPGDYRVVYRTFGADSSPGSWTEVPGGAERQIWSALWNPDRRHRKAIRDTCTRLDGLARSLGQSFFLRQVDTVLYTSLPYLTLLAYVSGLAERQPGAGSVQFAIVLDRGSRTSNLPTPIFVSSLHRIDRPDTACV